LLWGQQDEEHARNNLSQSLFRLRKALGKNAESILDANKDSVRLNGDQISVDALVLRQLAESDVANALCAASALCTGPLLEAFMIREEAFEDWLAHERESVTKLMDDVLTRQTVSQLAANDANGAVDTARRVVAMNELNEETHRLVMRACVAAGQRHAALLQYRACRELLRQELDVEPEASTKALYEEIQSCSADVDGQEREEYPQLPDRPSIAVLPFANLSGDPEQEYFAHGMAEDIITALSRFRWFFVIPRNSSFTYKGSAVDVREVGRELGVRYVLEGSVRRGGNRLRITAQLVEAATGNHLWAERYDGEMADVFDLQDRITEGVVGAVEPSVRQAEIERSQRKRPGNLAAYDLYLRALPHAWANTRQEASKALELLEQALKIDSNYVAAHAIAGWCRGQRSRYGGHEPKEWSEAVEHARKVVASGTDDAVALAFAGFTLIMDCQYDAALDAVARSVELTPNSAVVLARSALVNALAGNDDTAMDHAHRSIRLSPLDPMRYAPEIALCVAHFHGGRYEEAAAAAKRTIKYNPGFEVANALLAASYVRLGRSAEAKEEARRLLEINPKYHLNLGLHKVLRDATPFTAALREAGLPE
jgi:TolB-like protein/two-component SAPR family response regulator